MFLVATNTENMDIDATGGVATCRVCVQGSETHKTHGPKQGPEQKEPACAMTKKQHINLFRSPTSPLRAASDTQGTPLRFFQPGSASPHQMSSQFKFDQLVRASSTMTYFSEHFRMSLLLRSRAPSFKKCRCKSRRVSVRVASFLLSLQILPTVSSFGSQAKQSGFNSNGAPL